MSWCGLLSPSDCIESKNRGDDRLSGEESGEKRLIKLIDKALAFRFAVSLRHAWLLGCIPF